jgi:hypothetical protein
MKINAELISQIEELFQDSEARVVTALQVLPIALEPGSSPFPLVLNHSKKIVSHSPGILSSLYSFRHLRFIFGCTGEYASSRVQLDSHEGTTEAAQGRQPLELSAALIARHREAQKEGRAVWGSRFTGGSSAAWGWNIITARRADPSDGQTYPSFGLRRSKTSSCRFFQQSPMLCLSICA